MIIDAAPPDKNILMQGNNSENSLAVGDETALAERHSPNDGGSPRWGVVQPLTSALLEIARAVDGLSRGAIRELLAQYIANAQLELTIAAEMLRALMEQRANPGVR